MSDAHRDPDVSDREIVAVFRQRDEDRLRPLEVVEDLPLSIDRLYDRLDELSERGVIVRDDEDLPDTRWRLGPQADEVPPPDETTETELEDQADKVAGSEAPPHAEETPETPPPDPGEVEPGAVDVPAAYEIDVFEPPGTPEERTARRKALRQAYVYLRQRSQARREQFESELFPKVQAGYDDPDDWWREVIRPGLDSLSDVTSSEEDRHWKFTGKGHAEGPTEDTDTSQ